MKNITDEFVVTSYSLYSKVVVAKIKTVHDLFLNRYKSTLVHDLYTHFDLSFKFYVL